MLKLRFYDMSRLFVRSISTPYFNLFSIVIKP